MKSLFRTIKNILKYPFNSTKTDEKWITGFSDWFGSVQGFKQQTFIMFGWCVIVIIFPLIDPNMFHLMAFLTIYSAITQPILAFGNSRSNAYMLRLMKNNIHQMEAMLAFIENQQETIEKLNKLVNNISQGMEILKDDIEELQEDIQEMEE